MVLKSDHYQNSQPQILHIGTELIVSDDFVYFKINGIVIDKIPMGTELLAGFPFTNIFSLTPTYVERF